MEGRLTLIQSVTSAVPIYHMHTSWLPTHVCNKLDKLNRSFLWSTDVTRKKTHLVGVEQSDQTKIRRWARYREARKSNIAMLAKLGWRTLQGDDSLWSRVFRSKYLKESDIMEHKPKVTASKTWKGVIRSLKELESGIQWNIGDGSCISFWYDRWSPGGILANDIEGEIVEGEDGLMVSDLLGEAGGWKLEGLQTRLRPAARAAILNTPVPFDKNGADSRIWAGSSSGRFSCKSAYDYLRYREDGARSWNWIWDLKIPSKFKMFFWLCEYKSLFSNALRFDRHFGDSDACTRCSGGREDHLHIFRDCVAARKVWELLIMPTEWLEFQNVTNEDWIRTMLGKIFRTIQFSDCSWEKIFVSVVWSLWKARNKWAYQQRNEPPQITMNNVKLLLVNLERLPKVDGRKLKTRPREDLHWVRPAPGWVKLNTDGSLFGHTKAATAGGVIRDDNGNWIVGFTMKLGEVSINVAELLGIREGLKLAWERRFEKIEIETDSEVIYKLIMGDTEGHRLKNMVRDCKILLHKPWCCELRHVFRERNSLADGMAKLSHELTEDYKIWPEAPRQLNLLNSDARFEDFLVV